MSKLTLNNVTLSVEIGNLEVDRSRASGSGDFFATLLAGLANGNVEVRTNMCGQDTDAEAQAEAQAEAATNGKTAATLADEDDEDFLAFGPFRLRTASAVAKHFGITEEDAVARLNRLTEKGNVRTRRRRADGATLYGHASRM